MKVSKRLLWVGEAAYPLHHITRVHTFEVKPKRMEAFADFLKWVALVAVLVAVLQAVNQNSSSYSARNDSADGLWGLGGVLVVGLFVRMLKVWTAPPEHVLAIETSSASLAVVTLPDVTQLRALRGYIVQTIENPDTEVPRIMVGSLRIDRKNYQFGDTVNMYGGSANTGVAKK